MELPEITDPAQRLSMPNPCNNRLIMEAPLVTASAAFDIDLPGASEGNVVTRFPPEASGYLHVGHIKAAMLNEYYAKYYKGQLLLRFDDTNPAKEKHEFEQAIIEDLKCVGIKPDRLSYTSDYFDLILSLGTKMLEMGKAYIDDLPVEIMRDNRMKGIDSPCRANTIERNLEIWEEMKKGTEQGARSVMRAKIDMKSTNTALRDPVLFRTVNKSHARTGDKYKVYPSYDFACPIVDSVEGVTVSLRTIEYRDRNEQFHWVQDALGLRKVPIYDFARLNFVNTEMSKRKLQWFVDQGIAESWFDPRFPTVQGMMRRGLTVPALRAFVLEQGPSKNITYQEWDKIWKKNKQVIDPIAPRYTAIERENFVVVTLTDGPKEPIVSVVPRHRKNPAVGDKLVEFSNKVIIEQCDAELLKVGDEITLMGWGNIIIDDITYDETKKISSAAQFAKGAQPSPSPPSDTQPKLSRKERKKAKPVGATPSPDSETPAEEMKASPPPAPASAPVPTSSPAVTEVLVPAVKSVTAHMHLEGDFKKTKLKLTWLSYATPEALGVVSLRCFDHLLTKAKLKDDEKFEDFVNVNSKFSCDAFVEPAAKQGVVADIVQFERKGYFYLDQPTVLAKETDAASSSSSTPESVQTRPFEAVYHYIPEGRTMLMKIAGRMPSSLS